MHYNIPWKIHLNALFQGNNMFQHFTRVVCLQPWCAADTRLPAGLNLCLSSFNSPVADLYSVYGTLGYFHTFGT
jgi:hypothetical protein